MVFIDSKRPFYAIFIFTAAALVLIVAYQEYQKINEKKQIVIDTGSGPVKISVEYAETPEKQALGLMNRQSLPKNSGMLFIFSDEKIRNFWMKNTLIPLEIMFIATDGRISEIAALKPCAKTEKNCPVYTSKEPARFAVEVNAGFTERAKIIEGDILEISGF